MTETPDAASQAAATAFEGEAPRRVAELVRLGALRRDDRPLFEHLTQLAAATFQVPNVGIHLLDDERQWVKAFHGVIDTECPVDETICRYTVGDDAPLVFPDTRLEPRFADNPYVWTDQEPVRFYAGAPLTTSRGITIGTLCLLGHQPRADLNAEELGMLTSMAALTTAILELREDERASRRLLDRALEEDETTGWLRQQGLSRAVYRRASSQRQPAPAVVVDAGIEQFSTLRTAFGASTRDRLLRAAADRLARTVERHVQRHGNCTDVLRAHHGDGHFVIVGIFAAGTNDDLLHAWADALARAIVSEFEVPFEDEPPVYLTTRVGLTVDASGERPLHALIDAAHRPLEATQASGASSVVRDASDTSARTRGRFTLDRHLRRAIAEREFQLAFQPVVDLRRDRAVVGAEALLRWTRDDGETISPGVFIPAAEELGLIDRIDRISLDLAAEAQARWRASHPHLWLSVNVSPRHLASRTWVDLLLDERQRPRLDPRRTKLEITESGIAGAGHDLGSALARLRERGFELALDDFGTGHSSLARLIRLPFTVLKVDRAFVADAPSGPGAAIVAGLAQLGASLGLTIVGEGVETEEQEAFLRSHHYQLAQGYRYARPLPEEELLRVA